MGLLTKIFGDYSSKEVKKVQPLKEKVLSYEDEYKKLSEDELRGKTTEFKARLQKGETLDDILPEAYATVIEASARVLGMRHFPVQIIGGIILHQGRIAEMKTGEGKTLVATLPAYLNALTGKGVHIVTANEYLAKRDSEWMGKVYNYLGLSVGLIVPQGTQEGKKKSYAADITYGTNSEFAFDYLWDNLRISKDQVVQREHNYAIVDEVDSILIDEARTPHIISVPEAEADALYFAADQFVRSLRVQRFDSFDSKEETAELDCDYIVDEKAKTATLTEKGTKKAEQYFNIENLADPNNMSIAHHINIALKAHGVMKLDDDYVVKDGEVLIIDSFTGRIAVGRRYSNGLHQAIEMKEGLKVKNESKTVASITVQNYFRMYDKLSGMTGTALTEENEFKGTYGLDVVAIPTNAPVIREDMNDAVYMTHDAKIRGIAKEIKEAHEKGQPVLVGTVTIERSEELSKALKREGIAHKVLNAKFHEAEAQIIAQAGKSGSVTIATNMAGRGTDIILGGNAEYMAKNQMQRDGISEEMIVEATGYAETDDEEILAARKTYADYYEKYKAELEPEREKVVAAGGLYVLGTERHESRRIDNQLQGRSGRQGDPGKSKFFVSFEDDLLRLFGGERVKHMMATMKVGDDEVIDQKILSSVIENAQKNIEGRNYDARKNVLQYDDVVNTQRDIIYKQRRTVLNGENVKESIEGMIEKLVDDATAKYASQEYADYWELGALEEYAERIFGKKGVLNFEALDKNALSQADLKDAIMELAKGRYAEQEQTFGEENMRELERRIMLKAVDNHWIDHVDAMDQLKQEIRLRAYGNHNPVDEYKMVGFDMFEEMIALIREDTVRYVMNVVPAMKVQTKEAVKTQSAKTTAPTQAPRTQEPKGVNLKKATTNGGSAPAVRQPVRRTSPKIGRNDPCPCGSGKKYKNCCGRNAE
ncbi:MAG: preprotein translocase subunit SecA [Clostridia bacterium]|nr:preprotein translocase subunit SecA [Clostridia bacterium]